MENGSTLMGLRLLNHPQNAKLFDYFAPGSIIGSRVGSFMPTPDESKLPSRNDTILGRLAYLLSAQAVSGVLGTAFFLYLAWLNASDYGQVMYALAGGAIVHTIIKFGLYYPLVSQLGAVEESQSRKLLVSVQMIKLVLFLLCMAGVLIFAWRQELSPELSKVLAIIALGFSVEALAETFFAGLRVTGRQHVEARIKITASVAAFGYGFVSAGIGLSPAYVSLFKLISGAVQLLLGYKIYLKGHSRTEILSGTWTTVNSMFRASLYFALIEILGEIYNKTNIFFLQKETGLEGVAYYSATWNIVDAVSILGSEQFLGWVIFPLLATLWWKDRKLAESLVRQNSRWLMAIALPIIFVLHTQSSLIIGLIYPSQYSDAVWMQKYLVWTILISFQNNLFSCVMIVAGAVRALLAIQIVGTIVNIILNLVLVPMMKLEGGCLVIIFTKLFIACLTFLYCRLLLGFARLSDFIFPVCLGIASVCVFIFVKPIASLHPAVVITVAFYLTILFTVGPRFIGHFPQKPN